eukprot:6466073-Alexandrium_andersonii.AAC.1
MFGRTGCGLGLIVALAGRGFIAACTLGTSRCKGPRSFAPLCVPARRAHRALRNVQHCATSPSTICSLAPAPLHNARTC